MCEYTISYNTFALRVRFSCQEHSCLRSKLPNWISDYVAVRFIHARCKHFVKNSVFTKRFIFVFPVKLSIGKQYIIMDYFIIIMDYFSQEARRLISLTEGY